MRCSKCRRCVPIKAFAKFKHRDGRDGRRGICKDCRGQYAKENFERLQKWRQEYYKKNRGRKKLRDVIRRLELKKIIDEIKASTPCTDCGWRFPPVAMDFDHVGGKNSNVSRLVSGSYKKELVLAEIDLCELVCACCHRIRTSNRKENIAPRTHNK
jgi:hypothetical protein